MTKIALGIDLSTTATGLVILRGNGTPIPDVEVELELNKNTTELKDLVGLDMVREQVTIIMQLIDSWKPDRIVVEGYSLNVKNASSIIPLVTIGAILRLMMKIDGYKWADPKAGTVKKFATGKGTGQKDVIMQQVLKRWGFEAKTNNTCDAYVLALMGLAHIGQLPRLTTEQQGTIGSMKLLCN